MLLKPAPISTQRFHYHPDTKTFSAEASDLGPEFRLGRVYDDACDEGFTLVSHKTGNEIVFAHERSERDTEGELRFDEFLPAHAQGGQYGQGWDAAGLKVVIFND